MKIPFNKPSIVGEELKYIQDAVNQGSIASGGKYTRLCESFLETRYKVPKVMLTTSCTDALELAALVLDIKPGDKVAVPSYTYVSTANAFALRGAEIVFIDCEPNTLNLSLKDLKLKLNVDVKALVVMHYAGVANSMDEILKLCYKYDVKIIEDAALAIESKYKGKQLGTFGALGTFSFHQTKNVISGEGGALLINDESLVDKAFLHRDKGTNRNQFFKGEVDKYTWKALGSSFAPSDMVAAYLWGQLEKIDQIQQHRLGICIRYVEGFDKLPSHKVVVGKVGNGSVFFLQLSNENMRDTFISYMAEKGVKAVFHYQTLDKSPFMEGFSEESNCIVAHQSAKQIVRLPVYYSLSLKEQEYIIKTVCNFFSALPLN